MKGGGEIDFIASDLEDLHRIKWIAIHNPHRGLPLDRSPELTEDDRVILDFECKVINCCKKGKIPAQITIEDAKLIQG
jgi:hypothetical protein